MSDLGPLIESLEKDVMRLQAELAWVKAREVKVFILGWRVGHRPDTTITAATALVWREYPDCLPVAPPQLEDEARRWLSRGKL